MDGLALAAAAAVAEVVVDEEEAVGSPWSVLLPLGLFVAATNAVAIGTMRPLLRARESRALYARLRGVSSSSLDLHTAGEVSACGAAVDIVVA